MEMASLLLSCYTKWPHQKYVSSIKYFACDWAVYGNNPLKYIISHAIIKSCHSSKMMRFC